LPGKTRWQGKLNMVQSVLANKTFILTVLGDRNRCLSSQPIAEARAVYAAVKAKAEPYRFWEQLATLEQFLQPFLEVTIALESNKPKGLTYHSLLWMAREADGSSYFTRPHRRQQSHTQALAEAPPSRLYNRIYM
jgi:hypothetical protein